MLLQPEPNKNALLSPLMSSILALMHTARLAGQAVEADVFSGARSLMAAPKLSLGPGTLLQTHTALPMQVPGGLSGSWKLEIPTVPRSPLRVSD